MTTDSQMKLYYKPGACSLAVHIALNEVGAHFDLEQVDTAAGKTASGTDFATINPNGYVPALEVGEGQVLSEAPAVLQYLADQYPAAELAPEPGTLDRTRLQEHLNFTASELHKAFSPFFGAEPPKGEARQQAEAKVARRMDHIERLLSDGRTYLCGDQFTVADTYTFVVASWTGPAGIDLSRWPHVADYVNRVAARPATVEAMKAEGLIN